MPTGFWLFVKKIKRRFYYEVKLKPWDIPEVEPKKCPLCGCKSQKLFKPHPKHKKVYVCESCNKMTHIAIVGERRWGEWQ